MSSEDFVRDTDELIRKVNKKLESSPYSMAGRVNKPSLPSGSLHNKNSRNVEIIDLTKSSPDITLGNSSKTAPTNNASDSTKTGSEPALGGSDQVGSASYEDALWRARQIKAYISNHLTIHQVKERAVRQYEIDEAEEFKEIRKMRDQWNGSWDGITTIMNESRVKRGEPPSWTKDAVYCSYILSAPRVRPTYGDVWFNPQDYLYLRNPMRHPAANLPGALNDPSDFIYGAGGSHKRVRNEDTAGDDLDGNYREFCAEPSEQEEMLKNVYTTENLMKAVADVEKHFWGHVANAMWIHSARFFAADKLEKRFHEL